MSNSMGWKKVQPENNDYSSFEREPESYRNETKQNKNKKWIISLIMLILIIVGIIFYISYFKNNNSTLNIEQSNSNLQQSSQSSGVIQKNEHTFLTPVLDSIESKTIKQKNNEITVLIDKDFISLSNNHRIIFPKEYKLQKSESECKVVSEEDFCYVGNLSGKSGKAEIFFFKDLVNSRLFYNPINFEKLNLNNTLTSGIIEIDYNNNVEKSLLISFDDGSGLMFKFYSSTDNTIIEEFSKMLKIN